MCSVLLLVAFYFPNGFPERYEDVFLGRGIGVCGIVTAKTDDAPVLHYPQNTIQSPDNKDIGSTSVGTQLRKLRAFPEKKCADKPGTITTT